LDTLLKNIEKKEQFNLFLNENDLVPYLSYSRYYLTIFSSLLTIISGIFNRRADRIAEVFGFNFILFGLYEYFFIPPFKLDPESTRAILTENEKKTF